jgi:error-prone DNA polymerase
VGLRYRPTKSGPKKSGPSGYQLALSLPVEQDMAELPPQSRWEVMLDEYRTMGLHPAGHLMSMLRLHLPPGVRSSQEIPDLADGTEVTVAGLAIRRQRPLGKTVFVTLEDEFGHIPLVVWPKVYEQYRLVLRESVLIVKGEISRREGTLNIAVKHVTKAQGAQYLPKAKNWQ